jgi:hypothetical protein
VKIWIPIGLALVLVGILAAVLVHPGLPVGNQTEISNSKRSATLTCRYLHWDGVHSRDIDVSQLYFGPNASFSDTVCWRLESFI